MRRSPYAFVVVMAMVFIIALHHATFSTLAQDRAIVYAILFVGLVLLHISYREWK